MIKEKYKQLHSAHQFNKYIQSDRHKQRGRNRMIDYDKKY